MKVIYEDNHIIVVYKESGEIVQGDKTGDVPLSEIVKDYIKTKYQKPGNVFLGVVHRLDRPVSGLVVFARTSKALARLNKMFQTHDVKKTYWAIVPLVEPQPAKLAHAEPVGDGFLRLTHWIVRNEKQNKSYAYEREVPNSKKAVLDYRIISRGERYQLCEVRLHTGRHHQIRCQLSKIGLTIKGDLKYGSLRSNPDGSISLLSRKVEFEHPVSKEAISILSPVPSDRLWNSLSSE